MQCFSANKESGTRISHALLQYLCVQLLPACGCTDVKSYGGDPSRGTQESMAAQSDAGADNAQIHEFYTTYCADWSLPHLPTFL